MDKVKSRDIANNKKERAKILVLYIFFFGSIFSAFLPNPIVVLFSVMICICTLGVIYAVRSNAEEDSLSENHMTYLIRTFWRTNLYLLLSGFASGIYFGLFADYTALSPCFDYMDKRWMKIIHNLNMDMLVNLFNLCKKPFFSGNYTHLLITAFIAFSPIVLYLLLRYLRGWVLVSRYKNVPESKL